MDKPKAVYPYSGLVLSNKKGQTIMHITWTTLKKFCWAKDARCKRVHTALFYYMKLVKTKLVYGDRKADEWLPGARERGWGLTATGHKGIFFRWYECCISWLWWWLHQCIHLSKLIEMYVHFIVHKLCLDKVYFKNIWKPLVYWVWGK